MFHNFQNLRLDRKVVVLALDATSTDPKTARLVRVGTMTIEPSDPLPRVFATHIDPGVPISPAATARHGITDEDVKNTPSFASMAQELYGILDGAALVGYDIKRFSLPLLVEEFARCGMQFSLENRAILDAYQILQEMQPHTLGAALQCYCGMPLENRNEPDDDVDAVALVVDGLLGHYSDLPQDLEELHDRFAEWEFGGVFRREEGRLVLASGEYEGRRINEVADSDPEFLRRLLGKGEFPEAVQRIIRRTLQNAFCRNPDVMFAADDAKSGN